MASETTPLSGAAGSEPSIGAPNVFLKVLVVIGGIGFFGESLLAIMNHVAREQYRRLIIDAYCLLSAVTILGMEITLPVLNKFRQFLTSELKVLTSKAGLAVFYIIAGSFELTRDPTVKGGDLANILAYYMFALAVLILLGSFF
eukprot:CAMPEP_0183294504 /NCGR_PEP_ID=MMETSP0160_2-20130417/2822_1 /TAXON_ID=2839 ORGANISM="Odontella Sinensis, Strain Grunow 1884" /NCGR_SAMPLE_ID=MMETSP0160_2 /ASSEMBLY_ACC=CAM_ASM_000250 /LENGTH=143 /DNA_ID=CAMNT_0025455843 /DNA_START=35 /DNA_END=466 /DNA_ORIENTATION=+